MLNLDINNVIKIHDKIINKYGGEKGIKDMGSLDSSLNNAFNTFFGKDLYETDVDKISNIFYLLVKNHSFNDANKRTAVSTFSILLELNKLDIKITKQELENLALNIADNRLTMQETTQWLNSHTKEFTFKYNKK